uniref:Putative secreted protein n=1 Tax=Anopheles darlingi TaxID=43151 RepID=A0A2M4DMQ5_ANODA
MCACLCISSCRGAAARDLSNAAAAAVAAATKPPAKARTFEWNMETKPWFVNAGRNSIFPFALLIISSDSTDAFPRIPTQKPLLPNAIYIFWQSISF